MHQLGGLPVCRPSENRVRRFGCWGFLGPVRYEAWVPHTPGFPVELGGADELHAAFLKESRTRVCPSEPLAGNPGISLVFREIWDYRGTYPEALR